MNFNLLFLILFVFISSSGVKAELLERNAPSKPAPSPHLLELLKVRHHHNVIHDDPGLGSSPVYD